MWFDFEIPPQQPSRRNSATTWSSSLSAWKSISSGGWPWIHSAQAATKAPSMQWARFCRSVSATERQVSPSGSKLVGSDVTKSWIFSGVSSRARRRAWRGARPSFSARARATAWRAIGRAPSSVVALGALEALVALLRLEAERRDRPRLEALDPDRLAGVLAVAVGAVLDPAQRGIDLGDQLALAVAGPELGEAVGLGGGAVGEVGLGDRLLLQVLERLRGLAQELGPPAQQRLAEELPHHRVHERLVLGRAVVGRQKRNVHRVVHPEPVRNARGHKGSAPRRQGEPPWNRLKERSLTC